MLEPSNVALVRSTDGITAVEHHLVLHQHTLVPQWVLEPPRRAQRALGPVRERAVLTSIPPGDYLSHLHKVFGEQSRAAHHILQPHRRIFNANAPKGDGVKVSVQPTVVRPAE